MSNFFTVLEWSEPINRNEWLNDQAGIYFYVLSPGDIIVTDDNGNFGFYQWKNSIYRIIKSFRVDGKLYSRTTSYNDCLITNESFYYDYNTTILYVHYNNFDPPLGQDISYGVANGKIKGLNDGYVFNNVYYEPNLLSVFNISYQKDPLYYGKLVFGGGSVIVANDEGEYDNFGDRNLFGQPASIMIGQYGDSYEQLETIYTGIISDYSINWNELKIEIQDKRQGMTQPIADNLLTKTEYPYLSDNNENKPKPVAYGKIFGGPAISLNENQTVSNYTFMICDTQYNSITSIQEIRVAGNAVTPVSTDLQNGTFVLSSGTVGSNHSEVEVDFTMPIINGIDIIKDIVENYANIPYLSSFWDQEEMALQNARNTSIYIDNELKVWEAVEKLCNDISGNFIVKPDGRFTVRIFKNDNNPVKIIRSYDWSSGIPESTNNGSEFISSAIIEYSTNIKNGLGKRVENKDYETISFEKYKSLKKEIFETGLTNEIDAYAKAGDILDTSSIIQNIISRGVAFENQNGFKNQNILPVDIIIASPMTRPTDNEILNYYEILGVELNLENYTVGLTMRKISDEIYYDPVYKPWTDNLGNYITSSQGDGLIFKRV